jgi:phenylpyruvate tautomerase PptA (4-oxalocrotonate tautomerase family)
MPVLDVELVGAPADDDLAGRLAEATGAVLEAAPGTAWVRLRVQDPARYAENGGGPPDGLLPVFVTVLLADLPPVAERARLARGLAAAVARETGAPRERVHVLFEPAGRGRIAFGGTLVE